jgi:hypothetical protein
MSQCTRGVSLERRTDLIGSGDLGMLGGRSFAVKRSLLSSAPLDSDVLNLI